MGDMAASYPSEVQGGDSDVGCVGHSHTAGERSQVWKGAWFTLHSYGNPGFHTTEKCLAMPGPNLFKPVVAGPK